MKPLLKLEACGVGVFGDYFQAVPFRIGAFRVRHLFEFNVKGGVSILGGHLWHQNLNISLVLIGFFTQRGWAYWGPVCQQALNIH